jgi:hypothetical protein
LTVGIEGTAATKVKWTIPAISLGCPVAVPYNDVVTISPSWQQNGVRTEGTY